MTGLLREVDLPAPIGDRWFEDYVPGSVFASGHPSLSETETEIVAFARDYDAQAIYAEPGGGGSAAGPFDGMFAYEGELDVTTRPEGTACGPGGASIPQARP